MCCGALPEWGLVKRWHYSPWTLTRFVTLGSALVYLPVYLLFLPKQLADEPPTAWLIGGLICVSLGAWIASRPSRAPLMTVPTAP